MSVGTCTSPLNFINTQAACEEAAVALGLADTTASGNTYIANPYGCYLKQSTGNLYWSLTGSENESDQQNTDRVSLCVEAR
jgi:hypothetical protein